MTEHTNSYSDSYKEAGVDVTAGYRAVELMKTHIDRTKIPGVLEGIGGFGGMFALPKDGIKEPVLISGTDGVGTKLKIAFLLDKHDTIGIDCVAMCVNDIICAGAKPLFFLDYIAMEKVDPLKVEKIVSGVAEGCVQAGCALIGGETAEHPGMMPKNEYDIAGFSVGIAEKSKIPDKNNVKNGDVIIGIASSGVHSNGFSLIRKVFDINENLKVLEKEFDGLNCTLAEELIKPTKIYVKTILSLFDKVSVKGVTNITGGGFYENIPRGFSSDVGAIVQKKSFKIPEIFNLIAKTGSISEHDMFNTFNMGIGICVIVSPQDTDEALRMIGSCGDKATIIGEIKDNIKGVVIE